MEYTRSMTVPPRSVARHQLVDQGGGGGLGDIRHVLDAEVAAEILMRRIALDALPGQQPKQIAPLRLGYEANGTGRWRLGTRRSRL